MPAERPTQTPIHWPEEDPTNGRGYSYPVENDNSSYAQLAAEKSTGGGIRNSVREFYSNLTGKQLVSSFLILQLADVAMTNADLTMYHGTEANLLGGAELMSNLGTGNTEFIKLGLSALLVGAYILSSMHEKQLTILTSKIKTKYVTEKSLQGITALMSGAFLLNSINLSLDVIANIKF
jgi:hypothetical protein